MRYAYTFLLLSALLLAGCGQNQDQTENSGDPKVRDEYKAFEQPNSTMDSINKLIANDKYNAELLGIRAKLHLAARNMDAARNDINVANNIDTNVAVLREARGEMAYMLNKSRIARQEWEACIRIDPENTNCLMRLTELYIAVQNYDRALELVNRLIDIDSDDPQAYFMKGIIVRDKYKDTTLALQYFQNAVDIKQDYISALDMLGVLLAARGDTLAKYYYQRILDQQPNRDDIYYKLGVFYMDRGEVNRALEAYTKAIQINPRNSEAYYSMGYINIQLQDYARARDLFSQSIQAADRNYRAYYARGYSFEMLGDVINAKKDYRKALEILEVYTPAREALQRINRAEQEN